jgi:hypothetical protein
MRARYNGQDGELTIAHCAILRYMENGNVSKFYTFYCEYSARPRGSLVGR